MPSRPSSASPSPKRASTTPPTGERAFDVAREPRADLAALLADHSVVICVGSGGVGKTTTSAALAAYAARQGKTVLCLTIDPAKRLANSLGLSEMKTEEQEVPQDLFALHGLELRGRLFAMMLDTKRTFDELVRRHAPTPEARDRIFQNRIYQFVSSSLAGTREYMAMEKLHGARAEGRWDLIVLDTPPTSNALDFLEAPERIASLIDSPALEWFVRAMEGGGRFSFDLLQRGAAVVLKGFSKLTGAAFLEQIAEFVSSLNALFGGFRDRARRVAEDMRAPDVAFVIVTSPSRTAMREAVFFHEKLTASGITPKALIVNNVHQRLPDPALDAHALAGALAHHLGPAHATEALAQKLQDVLREHLARADADQAAMDDVLGQAALGLPMALVPSFDDDVHDLGALAKVADALLAGAPSNSSR